MSNMNLLLLLILSSVLCHCRADSGACSGGQSAERGLLVWNVSIASQLELNQFIENVTACGDAKKNTTKYLHISLVANDYELDIIKLMNISTGGRLVIKSKGVRSAGINCTADLADAEDLKPLSGASLVLLDGLIFTGCPVPILIEEVSNVLIQNCVFQ